MFRGSLVTSKYIREFRTCSVCMLNNKKIKQMICSTNNKWDIADKHLQPEMPTKDVNQQGNHQQNDRFSVLIG